MSEIRVLCDAVAFGYGPIGKLLTLRNLMPAGYKFTLLSNGSSYELAALSSFDRIIMCDTESPSGLADARSEFLCADFCINIMNPVSAAYARSLGIPTVYVDSLFWMWDAIPESTSTTDVYFIQNFVGVEEQLASHYVSNPVLVGAIVDDRFKSGAKKNQLMVNLGGLRSKLIQPGVTSRYPQVVIKILADALREHSFDRVLITGESDTMRLLAKQYAIRNGTFETLSHDTFLLELSKSRLLITSPGLTTTYEAFAYGVPAIFLPPQNFSQFLILKRLRDENAASLSFHWLDVYPSTDIEVGIPESVGVERVLSCIRRFEGDEAAQEQLATVLQKAANLRSYGAVLVSQTGFLSRMGMEGGNQIVLRIAATFGRAS